jgi:hypothetical protein
MDGGDGGLGRGRWISNWEYGLLCLTRQTERASDHIMCSLSEREWVR